MTASAGGGLTPGLIGDLYCAACLAELEALKPGNVHNFAAGHRMEVTDFVTSATASAPSLAEAGARIGRRVRGGVAATMAAVGQNTNLGILLLCAPLALAAESATPLREGLLGLLARLDATDAYDVFAAIRQANPGGLGQAERYDVNDPKAPAFLMAAMMEAAPRDRIARAYVDGFEDLFGTGLPALRAAQASGMKAPWTTTAVHLAYLACYADSHVARKHGPEIAEQVRRAADHRLDTLDLRTQPVDALMEHDRALKAAGINPGTTADFTVATLFLGALLDARGESWRS